MLSLDFDSSLPQLDDCTVSVTVVSSVPSQSDSTTNLVKWITHEEVKALNLINVVVKHLVNLSNVRHKPDSLAVYPRSDGRHTIRDHFESSLGIISGLGIISSPVGDHFRGGIISSPVGDNFRGGIILGPVGDHFRGGIISSPVGDHFWGGIISGPVGDHFRACNQSFLFLVGPCSSPVTIVCLFALSLFSTNSKHDSR